MGSYDLSDDTFTSVLLVASLPVPVVVVSVSSPASGATIFLIRCKRGSIWERFFERSTPSVPASSAKNFSIRDNTSRSCAVISSSSRAAVAAVLNFWKRAEAV